MAMASLCLLPLSYAVRQVLSFVPCAVTVHGAPGHNRWGVAETPLPAKSQGRNMDQSPVQGVVSRWGGIPKKWRAPTQRLAGCIFLNQAVVGDLFVVAVSPGAGLTFMVSEVALVPVVREYVSFCFLQAPPKASLGFLRSGTPGTSVRSSRPQFRDSWQACSQDCTQQIWGHDSTPGRAWGFPDDLTLHFKGNTWTALLCHPGVVPGISDDLTLWLCGEHRDCTRHWVNLQDLETGSRRHLADTGFLLVMF